MVTITLKQLIKNGLENSAGCALYEDSCCVVTLLKADIMRSRMKDKLIPSKLEVVSLMFIERGSLRLRSDLEEVTAEGPSLLGIRPGSLVQLESVSDDFCSAIVMIEGTVLDKLNLSVEKLIPHLEKFRNSRSLPLTESEMSYELTLLDALGRCIKEQAQSTYYHESVRSLLGALVCAILSLATQAAEEADRPAVKSREEEYFHRFMKLLRQYFRQERKITFYAHEMCLSPKYLSSLIRRFSGRGPSEWIDECVIAEAKNLLKFSDKSVQEVAYELNFPTQSFFGRYFKRHTGLSPKAFKQTK